MDLATRTELFIALLLVAAGLSHAARPRAWSQLFVALLTKPYAGLVIGTLTLPLGLAIVLTHNSWDRGPGIIVTLLGWAWTLKGTLYLLVPSLPVIRHTRLVERPKNFVIAGVAMITLGTIVLAGLPPVAA